MAEPKRLLWPITSSHVTIEADPERLHAATVPAAVKAKGRPATVCGYVGGQVAVMAAVDGSGDEVAALVMSWPPYASDGRCPTCWALTGKPRVSDHWQRKEKT